MILRHRITEQMPFLLSYNFIIQFVETFDPVKTFDLLDCD
eukprot:SAG25_NODE_1687_length_2548_cov_6.811862_2_plen_40_part_00